MNIFMWGDSCRLLKFGIGRYRECLGDDGAVENWWVCYEPA